MLFLLRLFLFVLLYALLTDYTDNRSVAKVK